MQGRQQVRACKLQDFPWSEIYRGGLLLPRSIMHIEKQNPKSTLSSSLLTCFSPDCCWCADFFFFYHIPSCVYLAGIRSWDTNLIDCNLDQELKLFVSRHSARFSADVKGKLELEEALIAQLQSDDDCSCMRKPNLIHPPPPPPPVLFLCEGGKVQMCFWSCTAHLKFECSEIYSHFLRLIKWDRSQDLEISGWPLALMSLKMNRNEL